METLRKSILLILLPVLVMGQKFKLFENKNDSISFSFNRKSYEQRAKDSVKVVFDKQIAYFKSTKKISPNKNQVALNLNWSDLKFYSIPKYRLKRAASKLYNCKSNIENFICFEEYSKYQDVLILKDTSIVNVLDVPNKYFELDRIYNPCELTMSLEEYNAYVLEHFLIFPEGKNYYRIMNQEKEKFFFTIFGLEGTLFEFDRLKGILFASWIGPGLNTGIMLANDYLKKYVGEVTIRDLANGYYEDIDNLRTINENPCKNLSKKISFKKIKLEVNEIR